MPKTLGGIVSFLVAATITVIVGTFVYNKLVSPLLAKMKQAA